MMSIDNFFKLKRDVEKSKERMAVLRQQRLETLKYYRTEAMKVRNMYKMTKGMLRLLELAGS